MVICIRTIIYFTAVSGSRMEEPNQKLENDLYERG